MAAPTAIRPQNSLRRSVLPAHPLHPSEAPPLQRPTLLGPPLGDMRGFTAERFPALEKLFVYELPLLTLEVLHQRNEQY